MSHQKSSLVSCTGKLLLGRSINKGTTGTPGLLETVQKPWKGFVCTLTVLKLNAVRKRAEKKLSVTEACSYFLVNARRCSFCWSLGAGCVALRPGVSTPCAWPGKWLSEQPGAQAVLPPVSSSRRMLMLSPVLLLHWEEAGPMWQSPKWGTRGCNTHACFWPQLQATRRIATLAGGSHSPALRCRSRICRDPSWRRSTHQEEELPFKFVCFKCLCLAVLIPPWP